MSQNSIAAVAALVIVLLLVVFFSDKAALAAASRALLSSLEQSETAEDFTGRFKGRGSRIVLDSKGAPLTEVQGSGMGGGKGQPESNRRFELTDDSFVWDKGPEVVESGSATGYGNLPWTTGNVLWAARSVLSSVGDLRVIVIWEQAGYVRTQGWPIYTIGVSGILILFILNLLFSDRVAKAISKGLKEVADTGKGIQEGNFDVRLPEQDILELEQIRVALNDLSSDLKRTNEELKAEERRLVQLEQTQKRFIADASHEIRAPLATMAITLDAWKDGLLSDEEKAGAMGRIRSEISRLSGLTEQLLDLSRIESGRLSLNVTAVDSLKVASSVVDSYKGVPGAAIGLSADGTIPAALADEQGLHRMLRNLIDNARRFTPASGSIDVSIRPEGGFVLIEVRDDGIGIPESEIAHMWDRFARAERDRSEGKGGTGLGLAIVKALADAMSAEVGLRSEEGKGTIAWIRLKRLS